MSLIKIKFTRSGVSGIGRRDLQTIGRNAIEASAKMWVSKFLPLHFKNTAFHRYDYRHRNTKYRKSKIARTTRKDGRRAIGEDLPLVFSGATRRSALRGSRIEPKATSYRSYHAEITIPARALNFIPKLREELTMVNAQEYRTLEKEFARAFEHELNKKGRTQNAKTKTYK